jgi:curved DNA-binding protein
MTLPTQPTAADLKAALQLFQLAAWPCTPQALRQRYRQLVKKTHPDVALTENDDTLEGQTGNIVGGGKAFQHVQLAYQLLLQKLQAQQRATPQPQKPKAPPNQGQTQYNGQRPITQFTLNLTAKQASQGGKHALALDYKAPCHRCFNLPGKTHTCQQCQGAGQQTRVHKLNVMLPKGLTTGSQLRLVGQGVPLNGNHPTDLLITFNVESTSAPTPATATEPKAQSTLAVTVWQALLQQTVVVQTPSGPVSVALPAGMGHGQTLMLPQPKGQPAWAVVVHIAMPANVPTGVKTAITQAGLVNTVKG